MTSYRFSDGSKGYSLRGESYRYIYYPALSLEELYDHGADPSEYDNIAYLESNQSIIERFRAELINRVEGLSLEEMAKSPKGYTIQNGKVINNSYEKLEVLPFVKKHFPLNLWQ